MPVYAYMALFRNIELAIDFEPTEIETYIWALHLGFLGLRMRWKQVYDFQMYGIRALA